MIVSLHQEIAPPSARPRASHPEQRLFGECFWETIEDREKHVISARVRFVAYSFHPSSNIY